MESLAQNQVEQSNYSLGFESFKPDLRLGRIEYLGLFSSWLAMVILGVFVTHLFPEYSYFSQIASILLMFIGAMNIFLITIRRLHDFDFNGWWAILCTIPIVGFIWLFAIMSIPSSNSDNR